ncbi:hypothetical protein [Nesterenkonia jeotgali]|uniref:Asp23/Gls24 family envelope stress response protein n=1 Tax=Nesterenkonia jeotgali TaxID=317018 RepID=A0A0W8II67_9MICC|nr:hypothetical protein [Nesterenkonia jeotgali]KUG59710.1 hypothetical protein AVL63_11475 [Nesterenkonia jeotgali]MBA8921975.1 hypothetical protein [Nesterenkonia jeotgali]
MTQPPSDPREPADQDVFDDISEAQALESYDRLRTVVDDYRRTETAAGEELTGLKARIMSIVEDEAARGPSTSLYSSAGLPYAMTTASLRAQVRAAVDAEPGLRARRVKVLSESAPGAPLDLRVTFTMSAGQSLIEFAPRLRARIAERIELIIGVRAGYVDLVVEDIHDE